MLHKAWLAVVGLGSPLKLEDLQVSSPDAGDSFVGSLVELREADGAGTNFSQAEDKASAERLERIRRNFVVDEPWASACRQWDAKNPWTSCSRALAKHEAYWNIGDGCAKMKPRSLCPQI